MNLLIHFLLISCLCIIIIEAIPLPDTNRMEAIAAAQYYIAGSEERGFINLKLTKGGQLYRSNFTLVWKGTYNDTIDVVIKIPTHENSGEREIYGVLKAAEDINIERYRIPRVYYQGPIFIPSKGYVAIAMTLFEETLEKRFKNQNHHFSDPTILLIFKQTVEALDYIHSKKVVHYDIKLANIFLRGPDVFLGDFDYSQTNGNPMTDFDGLNAMVWEMLHVPKDRHSRAFNFENCKYFKDLTVQGACQLIFFHNLMFGRRGFPVHKEIIQIADNALNKIEQLSGSVQFDWLKETRNASSGESSRRRKSK